MTADSTKTIIPDKEHFPGRISWKVNLSKIVEKFTAMNLMKKALKTQFQFLFKSEGLAFSGTIVHQMLLRKSSSNEKEIKFLVNGEETCFDMKAYALVTGLNFGRFPAVDIAERDEECPPPLADKYFTGRSTFKIIELESSFIDCTDIKDAWKMGLICLVCQYLLAIDTRRNLDIKILGMADKMHRFLEYPWGKVSFIATLKGVDKDIKHLRAIYLKNVDLLKKGELSAYTDVPAYTIHGFALAFQVWAYEVIKTLVPQFALRKTRQPNTICPRLILYSSIRMNNISEVVNALKGKVVSKIEESEEENNLYGGEDFEEMGVSFFDQYIEVGKKRKPEDVVPPNPTKSKRMKVLTIAPPIPDKKRKSPTPKTAEKRKKMPTPSVHTPFVPTETTETTPPLLTATRNSSLHALVPQSPLTNIALNESIEELKEAMNDIRADMQELKAEMQLIKDNQLLVCNQISILIATLQNQNQREAVAVESHKGKNEGDEKVETVKKAEEDCAKEGDKVNENEEEEKSRYTICEE